MNSNFLFRIGKSEYFYQDKNAFKSLCKVSISHITVLILWRLLFYPEDIKIVIKLLFFRIYGYKMGWTMI